MAEREWTPEQLDAIRAETGTLLVSAAAGSGKTSVLTERIVRKLTDAEDPCPPEALLVVTFTNAAAAEMRERIFQRVREKALAEPDRASFYRALTGTLSGMQVSTIDSFCMRLVREHFSDCGADPAPDVLEEGEERALKNAVVCRVIEERYAAADPAFLSLTALFDAGRDDAGLIEGILSLADFSMSEPSPEQWLRGVGDRFTADAPAARTDWGRLLLDRARAGVGYCLTLYRAGAAELQGEETLWPLNEDLFRAETAALEKAARTLAGAPTWDAAAEALREARAAFNGKFNTKRGFAEAPLKKRAVAKRDRVKKTLDALQGLFCATEAENAGDVKALKPAVEALVETALAFNEQLFAEKQARGKYGFTDIEHFCLRLLWDPAAEDGRTPLARELGDGLREILIDEYQDTNRAQDTIFRALSKDGGNLFMVGDVKQSIYRFRLASPELFIEKCAAFPPYDGKRNPSKIILGKNFRSRRDVTETVNDVFSALMSPACGEIDYNEDEALRFGAAYYDERADCATEWLTAAQGDTDGVRAEAAACADRIRRYLDEGFPIQTKDGFRPARCGDFCVLLRSGRDAAEEYAEALRARGIPVSLDSRAGFFDTAEIRMLLSLLNAVENPLRDVELLAVMLSPLFGFTPDEAARVKSDSVKAGMKKASLYARVALAADQGDEKCRALLSTLTWFRRAGAALSCAELLRALFDETPLLQIAGAMPEGKLRQANLRALAEAAERFCSDGAKSTGAFLRYLASLKENGGELKKGSVPADGDAVRVMTMHRSKGLEFPVVFLGGVGRNFNLRERSNVLTVSHRYGVGLKRREPEQIRLYDTLSSMAVRLEGRIAALSEELRIWYVAMTRAKEKLILLGTEKDPRKTLGELELLRMADPALPPYAVSAAASPMDWFGAVFVTHPDCAALRQYGVPDGPASGRLSAALLPPPEKTEKPPAAAPAAADPALTERLAERFRLRYPYLAAARLPAKHTASSLKAETFSPAKFAARAPAFMYEGDLSPADRGTATHRFLETCDFSAAAADPQRELQRLVRKGRLTERAAVGVDLNAIGRFFSSDLFKRIASGGAVWRERRFTVAVSVCDLDPTLPESLRGELTVVDGMTDLIFLEDGKAVIVDYKTDRVRDKETLRERYTEQMRVYADAAEQTLGVPVKECLLYSLALDDTVKILRNAEGGMRN